MIFAAVYARLGILKSHPVRWLLALAYTLLVTVMLVQSSGQPMIGPPAPPGPPSLLRELELTMGHIVAFSGLVVLWWWAMQAILSPPRALFVAVGFAVIFGFMSELAQTLVSDRQASLFDLAVNWTSTVFTAAFILEKWRDTRHPPRQRLSEPSSKMPVG
jgi:VanZ family protein